MVGSREVSKQRNKVIFAGFFSSVNYFPTDKTEEMQVFQKMERNIWWRFCSQQ